MYREIILKESKNNSKEYLNTNRQILQVVLLNTCIKTYLTL